MIDPDPRAHDGKIAGAIVTYFPDEGFAERLAKMFQQFDRIAIIDNASEPATLGWLTRFSHHVGLSVYYNRTNLGVATALNQAIEMLAAEGFEWVATFDQDTIVSAGFVTAMGRALKREPRLVEVALIGANRRQGGPNDVRHRWLRAKNSSPFFERVPCERIDSEGVSLLITSGTLLNTQAFAQIGRFRDDLFIDLVDSEYCLRALSMGFRLLVCCEAGIFHRVGEMQQHKIFGLTIVSTHHSALRRYYLFRNGIAVMRAYGAYFPYWLAYQILSLIEVVCGVILFESDKLVKLRACAVGAWDGMRGRSGPARREF